MKDLKVKLGGHDTKEVILPTYRDDGRDEILLILVKEFNIISEDEDLFKEQDIGEEGDRHNLSALKKRHKLKNIKETFRKFRVCLKENSRDMWINLIEDQPVLTSDNYEVDNTYGVKTFFKNQRSLSSESLNEYAVKITKGYRSLKVENYIRRVKTLNNYIHLMKREK